MGFVLLLEYKLCLIFKMSPSVCRMTFLFLSSVLLRYLHSFPTRRSSDLGRLNVDGMNIISNDGSNKLNRSRKARVSYKVQRTINASLNAATSTRAVSSNPNFVTRQKIEIIFG